MGTTSPRAVAANRRRGPRAPLHHGARQVALRLIDAHIGSPEASTKAVASCRRAVLRTTLFAAMLLAQSFSARFPHEARRRRPPRRRARPGSIISARRSAPTTARIRRRPCGYSRTTATRCTPARARWSRRRPRRRIGRDQLARNPRRDGRGVVSPTDSARSRSCFGPIAIGTSPPSPWRGGLPPQPCRSPRPPRSWARRWGLAGYGGGGPPRGDGQIRRLRGPRRQAAQRVRAAFRRRTAGRLRRADLQFSRRVAPRRVVWGRLYGRDRPYGGRVRQFLLPCEAYLQRD